jgi:hypothetical protein
MISVQRHQWLAVFKFKCRMCILVSAYQNPPPELFRNFLLAGSIDVPVAHFMTLVYAV